MINFIAQLRKSRNSRRRVKSSKPKSRRSLLEQCEDRRMMACAGTPQEIAQTASYADFNGDGFDDLAIGVPGENGDAGAVNVIYGSEHGLHAYARNFNQYWTQSRAGTDVSERYDGFGASLAAGDFDGDGFDDLAIGAPGESGASGAVTVLRGSRYGLTASGSQFWNEALVTRSSPNSNSSFGLSVVAGDFNRDGRDDLAIGAPGLIVSGQDGAGGVFVLPGSAGGLTSDNYQLWHQNIAGIAGGAEAGDRFGRALAAGDFNNDGMDDLAIGVPGEDLGRIADAGVVNVIYAASQPPIVAAAIPNAGPVSLQTAGWGLSSANDQMWHQNVAGIYGGAEAYDQFGNSLAIGDFNRDGFDDLAIGVAYEDIHYAGINRIHAGAVNVIFSRAGRLDAYRNSILHLGRSDIAGTPQGHIDSGYTCESNGGKFGAALVSADFNGDGYDDLAIGSPGDRLGGSVRVFYGTFWGLPSWRHQYWHQDSTGIFDQAESGDRFGSVLTAGDFNGDGIADLAIGVPRESIGSVIAGAVNVIYGSHDRLTAHNNQVWHRGLFTVLGNANSEDYFGGYGG